MRGINHIEVHNFKSYRGTKVIGPFMGFTAIVGPNGSGKSNVMDAITFVLGVSAGKIRADKLRQLVNARAVELGETSAYVELVYRDDEDEDKGGEEEVKFRRTIRLQKSSSGQDEGGSDSIYSVNGTTVSKKVYEQRLESIGIIARAANFLVPQNEVESVAQKTPMQLTQYIELISGSAALQGDYEAAAERAREAENEFLNAFRQKQSINKEHKQVREQMEEARKFRAMLEELSEARLESVLFSLYHSDKEIKVAKEKVRGSKDKLYEAKGEGEQVTKEMNEYQQKTAQVRRELMILEKARGEMKRKVADGQPALLRAEEEIKYLRERKEGLEASEKDMEKEIDQHRVKIRSLTDDLANVERARADLEAELESEQGKEMKLAEKELQEYRKLRAVADQETAPQRERLEQLRRQQDMMEEQLRTVEKQLEAMVENRNNLREAETTIENRVTHLKRTKEDLEKTIARDEATVVEMEGEMKRADARKEELKKQLDETKRLIMEANVDKAALERASKALETLRSLKALYPGLVRGRLMDLCKPVQHQYAKAVEVALGRHLEAIVVRDEETALKCIQYLKDHRLGMATFIPLSTIRVPPVNELLRRQLKGSFRLVHDIIDCEEIDRKAVIYAVGSAVVCGTLREARQFAYEDPLTRENKVKVVTLDGSVIHKSGNMTGGVSGGGQAGRFGEVRIAKLQEESKQWFNELAQLTTTHRQSDQITRLRYKVEAARTRLKHTNADLENALKDVARVTTKAKDAEAGIEKKKGEVERLRTEVKAKKTQTEQVQHEVEAVLETRLRDFMKRVKATSIQDFEERRAGVVARHVERRVQLAAHVGRLKSQLEYEKSVDKESALRKIRMKLDNVMRDLSKAEKAEKEARATQEEDRRRLKELEEKVSKEEASLLVQGEKYKELREQVTRTDKEISRLEKEVATYGMQVAKAEAEKIETLRRCRLEQIKVPRLKDRTRKRGRDDDDVDDDERDDEEEEEEEEGGVRERQRRRKTEGEKKGKRRGGSAMNDEDEGGDRGEHKGMHDGDDEDADGKGKRRRQSGGSSSSSSSSHRGGGDDGDDDINEPIDYAQLPTDEDIRNPKDISAVKTSYAEKIAELTALIEKMSPNARADEHEADVANRLKANREAFEQKQQEQKRATDEFEAIKAQRRKRFMRAYDSILKNIDGIYKTLTSTGGAHAGGRAYLSLENTEEPYLHGVNYSVTPPQKHYREMGSLSGGEKTMAALALLFAIHQYRAAPFFVLDEVDAALDSANVAMVANYIRTRSDMGLQCIVISLKDALYCRADGLVGVYRDNEHQSSGVLTQDLRPYVDTASV